MASPSIARVEESDVEDYMADVSRFVHAEEFKVSSVSERVTLRFGQKPKFSEKNRKPKAEKKDEKKTEESLRQTGLETSISSDNIGFKLLQQMGYKPGKAIGKTGFGSIDPIKVDIKRGKGGLGRDEIVKEVKKRKEEEFFKKMEEKNEKIADLEKGYQNLRRDKWETRKLKREIKRAKNALCLFEEKKMGFREISNLEGRGKEELFEKDDEKLEGEDKEYDMDEEEEEREEEEEEMLFLRKRRKKKIGNKKDWNEDEDVEEDEGEREEEGSQEILQELLNRLRNEYFYCIYCGFEYSSKNELDAKCPGENEEIH